MDNRKEPESNRQETSARPASAKPASAKPASARPVAATTAGDIHGGHRQRLRARFLKGGPDDFAPHELLELVLCYAIPRGDVNPLAHRLIQRFGSLSGVLEAGESELRSVDGVGDSTACLLRLLPAVMRAYAVEKNRPAPVFDTVGKLVAYLRPLYVGLTTERVYLILLDNGMRMIDCISLGDGAVNCSAVTVRRIAELCLTNHAACAVLAHNHPKGMAIPSGADLEVTNRVDSALETVGVPLLEHLIITEYSDAAILRGRKGTLRASPITGELDQTFYETFYRDLHSQGRWDDFLS